MARILASIAFLLTVASLRASAESELAVRVELSGYTLFEPRHRCCAFTLDLDPTGRVKIRLKVDDPNGMPSTRVAEFVASDQQVTAIREAIEGARFFDLPPRIAPPGGFHPDFREVQVRLGVRSHRVVLELEQSCALKDRDKWGLTYDQNNVPHPISLAEKDRVDRACRVWRTLRTLVTDPQATVQ